MSEDRHLPYDLQPPAVRADEVLVERAPRPGRPPEPPAGEDRPPPRFQGGSLRLFRLAGIDVFLHWSWVVVAYFQISYRSNIEGQLSYHRSAWAAIEYVTLFGIVLLHEFGHALACRSVGGTANRITLWPLGGIAFVNPPPRPGAFLWSIVAGPLVNLVLIPVTVGLLLLSTWLHWERVSPDLHMYLVVLVLINAGLLLFNVLPIYPLDGGQILQGMLWFLVGRATSLMVVAILGLIVGGGILVLALLTGMWWFVVLAGFGLLTSFAGLQRARMLTRMLNAPRYEGLACPACGKAPPAGDFWFCQRCFQRFDAFAHRAQCPSCSARFRETLCPECLQRRPYVDWHPEVLPVDVLGALTPEGPELTPRARPAPPPPPAPAVSAPRVRWQRRLVVALVCAGIAVVLGLGFGLGNDPSALVVLGVGGALFGLTTAGPLARGWRNFTRGPQRAQEARDELKSLEGTWLLVEVDGRPVTPEEAQRHTQLIRRRHTFQVRNDGVTCIRGTFSLGAHGETGAIDLLPTLGLAPGQTYLGVYEVRGDLYRERFALPGQPRAGTFASTPEGQRLRVWQRARN